MHQIKNESKATSSEGHQRHRRQARKQDEITLFWIVWYKPIGFDYFVHINHVCRSSARSQLVEVQVSSPCTACLVNTDVANMCVVTLHIETREDLL